MTYRELWEAELCAGVGGQQRHLSSTWKLDGLWRAACYEASATEYYALSFHATRSGDPITGAIHLRAASELMDKADEAFVCEYYQQEAA